MLKRRKKRRKKKRKVERQPAGPDGEQAQQEDEGRGNELAGDVDTETPAVSLKKDKKKDKKRRKDANDGEEEKKAAPKEKSKKKRKRNSSSGFPDPIEDGSLSEQARKGIVFSLNQSWP